MNRSELTQVAHGLKAARPDRQFHTHGALETAQEQWAKTVTAVADALELRERPRSIFLAVAGLEVRHG